MNLTSGERRPILLVLVLLVATPGWAQENPERHGFWAGAQLGYGSLDRSSDQEPLQRQGVFAMAFRLGCTLHPCLRLGAELNGWLLEAFDPNDPAMGESVSQALVIAQIYYRQGSLGHVANQVTTIENREYQALDMGVSLICR
jgi:hypothetical protein